MSFDCINVCKKQCNYFHYKLNVNSIIENNSDDYSYVNIQYNGDSNVITFKIINKSTVNDLIYNCGGIIALWFGVPLMITYDLIVIIQKFAIMIYNLFIKYLIKFILKSLIITYKHLMAIILIITKNCYHIILPIILLFKEINTLYFKICNNYIQLLCNNHH